MANRSTQELFEDIFAAVQSELGVQLSATQKSTIRAESIVLAGAIRLIDLDSDILERNFWPDTADTEANGGTLERIGRLRIQRNPFPATQAIYQTSVTGQIGATIPVNTLFRSDDDSLNQGGYTLMTLL